MQDNATVHTADDLKDFYVKKYRWRIKWEPQNGPIRTIFDLKKKIFLCVFGTTLFLKCSVLLSNPCFTRVMSAAPYEPTASGDADGPDNTAVVPLDRLRQLEALEVRCGLQARHIEQLQARVEDLEASARTAAACSDSNAEAFMRVARSSDERAREMEAQHAAANFAKDGTIARLQDTNAANLARLEAAHAATVAQLREALAKSEGEKAAHLATVAQLTAAVAQLTTIHAAVTAVRTLEIHPARADGRQFAEWRDGRMPGAAGTFDHLWCAAYCSAASRWRVDIHAGVSSRAHVTQEGSGALTLRSAVPLPRRQQQPPAYRVIVEAYSDVHKWCYLGFVPSHRMPTQAADSPIAVTPDAGSSICNYGGWYILVAAAADGEVERDPTYSGWAVVPPVGAPGAAGNTSTYATTAAVPPVPPGSAVEFAVDYVAGTCRVAFYTAAAAAGGFAEAPHAKMELRFVATEPLASLIPARSLPAADRGVELYPAAETGYKGAIWRFADV
jgi:hypothetical protein